MVNSSSLLSDEHRRVELQEGLGASRVQERSGVSGGAGGASRGQEGELEHFVSLLLPLPHF